jgi:hypothetical protein
MARIGGLRISLRVQHIVHTRNIQGDDGILLHRGNLLDGGPQLVLQFSGVTVDLPKLNLVAD